MATGVRLRPARDLSQVAVLPTPWAVVSGPNDHMFAPFAPVEVLVSRPAAVMGRASGLRAG